LTVEREGGTVNMRTTEFSRQVLEFPLPNRA
jgi:hypothetical protein